MTSANPSPRQFLPLQLTAYVSWLQADRHASAALKQRMTPLEHSPQRDTLLEAPWNGTVTGSSPLGQKHILQQQDNSFHSTSQRNGAFENNWQQLVWIILSNWLIFLDFFFSSKVQFFNDWIPTHLYFSILMGWVQKSQWQNNLKVLTDCTYIHSVGCCCVSTRPLQNMRQTLWRSLASPG